MSIKLKTPSGGSVTLVPENTASNVNITVPGETSTLITSIDIATAVNAANDAAAAASGIPVGGLYRNGSQLMVRVV